MLNEGFFQNNNTRLEIQLIFSRVALIIYNNMSFVNVTTKRGLDF